MLRILTLVLTAAAMLMLGLGCSDNPASTNDPSDLNLEEEFGGYTDAAEQPAFGDDEIASLESGETIVDDAFAVSPDVVALEEDPQTGRYHLRATWGMLRYDSSVTEVTDWSGSLTVTRGAIVIRRAIHFELGQDFIPTRTARELLEWVSYTTVHNDGIVVDIFVPPPSDTGLVEVDPVTVMFETGPYSRTFTLSELEKLDTIVYLEDSNAVAFSAFRLDDRPCPRGFMAGYWGYDEDGNGVFAGAWLDRMSSAIGHFHGHFGVNEAGRRVFYGKVIDRAGEFEWFLKGTWGAFLDNNTSDRARHRAGGWFEGRIFNADSVVVGVLKGKYRSDRTSSQGYLHGRWGIYCGGREDAGFADDGF